MHYAAFLATDPANQPGQLAPHALQPYAVPLIPVRRPRPPPPRTVPPLRAHALRWCSATCTGALNALLHAALPPLLPL